MDLVCEPALHYGRTPAEWTLVDGSRHAADATVGGQSIRLQTDLALGVEGNRVRARHVLSAGEECYCALSWADGLTAPEVCRGGQRPRGRHHQVLARVAGTGADARPPLARPDPALGPGDQGPDQITCRPVPPWAALTDVWAARDRPRLRASGTGDYRYTRDADTTCTLQAVLALSPRAWAAGGRPSSPAVRTADHRARRRRARLLAHARHRRPPRSSTELRTPFLTCAGGGTYAGALEPARFGTRCGRLVDARTTGVGVASGTARVATAGVCRRHRPRPRGCAHRPRCVPWARCGLLEVWREARPRGSGRPA